MPIETSQRILALRSKKNAEVEDNLVRLGQIARNSHSAEDILRQLHPWGAPNSLKFDNSLAIFMAIMGSLLLLPLLLQPTALWTQLVALCAALLLFLSYLFYAAKKPITETIELLEENIIEKKYQLDYQLQPAALGRPLSPTLLISQLKQQFPIFNRGSISNDIPFFASSIWQEADGKNHQVLIFQYHFINELQILDKNGERMSLKEIHQDLWGVFVFDLDHDLPTFAASTEHKKLPYPYHLPWQSSDIQIRKRLYMGGENPFEMAKKIGPAFTLKLGEFFAERKGELYINHNQNMLCYLGPHNLMQIKRLNTKKIQDISTLRGHLRTFKLPLLERLKKDLITLLQ